MVAALRHGSFPDQVIAVALALLATYPYVGVVHEVVAKLDEARNPKQVRTAFEQLAAMHPPLAHALAGPSARPRR